MKINVGVIDRVLRIALGLALVGATLFGYIGIWGWLGVIPLLTAAFSSCPVYSLLNVSTTNKDG